MGLYLLKRLLFAIPALWALATVIFLLSRLLPGTFGSERILQSNNAGFYVKGNAADKQKAYDDYVKRTGQHLPLFYISISTNTPPGKGTTSTPYISKQHSALAWRYGNAQLAAAFVQSVTALEKEMPPNADPEVELALRTLGSETSLTALKTAAQVIQNKAKATSEEHAATGMMPHLEAMQQRHAYAYLVPAISWHGTHNQYHRWLVEALGGNLGYSYRTSLPVVESLLEAIGNTWWLLLSSMLLTLVLALELSILMVQQKGKWLQKALLPFLFITDSIPSFVLALLLLVLLANPDFLQLFPVYGMGYYAPVTMSVWQEIAQWAYYMALPILCLILFNLPYLTNQMYTSLRTAMQSDYTRTAKAKGLREAAIIRKHALRNSLLPIITIISDFLPALVTGTFIVETIFAVPGIGRMLIEAVLSRDYPILTGIVLLIAAFRIVAFILADIAYAWADPRVNHRTV